MFVESATYRFCDHHKYHTTVGGCYRKEGVEKNGEKYNRDWRRFRDKAKDVKRSRMAERARGDGESRLF
jgi:hypothetical protein